MLINKWFTAALCAAMLIGISGNANETLKPGAKAPALDVEHWVSNGNGKFKKITEFESGKVYVVEFWATWCGPCIASMPHLKELQERYADKGLQIISISDEDMDTVEEFLQREVRGGDGETYAELTSAYCLTTDPDNSSHEAYMEAAGRNGIPCAFVIGKQGDLELICHPMELDEPLELILAGKWDRDEYEAAQKKKKSAERKMMRELQTKMREVAELMREKDADGAIKIVDELIKKYESHPVAEQLKASRVQMAIMGGGKRGAKALIDFANSSKKNSDMLNQIAWSVVEMKQAGEEVDEAVLAAAEKVAKMAVDAEPESGAILDTYAHLIYMNGNLDKAIEVQKKAVENAGSLVDEVKPFLEKLLKEKSEK